MPALDNYSEVFIGDIGIKSIIFEDEEIYSRPGGYFYLSLDTDDHNTEMEDK